MQTQTVVHHRWQTDSAHAVTAALLCALGVTPGADGAALEESFAEETLGTGIYSTIQTTETLTLTGVSDVSLQVALVSETISGPVDPVETLIVTVGADDPERQAAALAVLAANAT